MMKTRLKFLVILLAMVVGGVNGAWAAKTVGASNNSTGYEGASSDTYSLTPGDQIQFEFKNYSSKGQNWYNWLLFISGATDNPFVLRADNYWFSGSYNSGNGNNGNISATLSSSIDWNNFRNDMDGANVTINVVHGGSTISVSATATNNNRTHTETLSLTPSDATATITTKLSIEYAHLEITKIKCTYDFISAVNSRINPVGGGTSGSWELGNGLHNETSGIRQLEINELQNGDHVKVTYSGSGNIKFNSENIKTSDGTFQAKEGTMTSNDTYKITEDGKLVLDVPKYGSVVKITAIEITRYPEDEPSLALTGTPSQKYKPNETYTTAETHTPTSATVVFSSSDASVATVNKMGVVTAVAAGTAIITASLTVGGTTVTTSYYFDVISSTTALNYYNFVRVCNSSYLGGQVYDTGDSGNWYALDFLHNINNDDYKYNGNTVYFNHPQYAKFAIVDQGWEVKYENGLVNESTANDYYAFYIVELHNGDGITVNLKNDESATITSDNTKTYVWENGERTLKSVAANSTFESGKQYIIQSDGILKLKIRKGDCIQNIVIEHETATPSFSWSDANLSTKFDISNGGKWLRYNLATLNFTEPTGVPVPSTAAYTVRSLNENVAKIGSDGEVMFVNTGTVNIQGTMKTNGNDYRDTYTVDVWADPGDYIESGNTCSMSGIGMLNTDRKIVSSISGITMEFGSAEDATLIVEKTSGNTSYLVAYTINKQSGWRHKSPCCSLASPDVPTNGSFYKFTAHTDGTLSFKGIKDGGVNTVVLVDASDNMTTKTSIAEGSYGYVQSSSVDLDAGHVYYLYGNVPENANSADGWSAFLLSEFTFVSDFKLKDLSNNEVSYGAISSDATLPANVLTIDGISNPQVEVVGRSGDISAATFSVASGNTLQITSKTGTGGAVRLKISDGGSAVKYYTLTIPYSVPQHGSHVWDFRTGTGTNQNGQSTTEIVSALKDSVANTKLALSGLARTYKVISKSGGHWEHLIEPIIAVNGRVLGDNGFYFTKTAGLIFETRSLGLGARETKVRYYTVTDTSDVVTYYSSEAAIPNEFKNKEEYTVSNAIEAVVGDQNYPIDDEAEYRLTPEATQEADHLKLRGASKIIFPGVKAGQYIKMYTYRHSDGKGETYYAQNMVDLDNNSYSSSSTFAFHGILNGDESRGINRCYGAMIFKVPSNYSNPDNIVSQMPAVTLSDDGWANIYKIEVCDDYSTDMKMSLDRGTYPEFLDVEPDCEYASVVIKDGNPVIQNYSGVCTQILIENAGTVSFTFEPLNGLTAGDYTASVAANEKGYNIATVQYKSGRGVLKITQKEVRGGYTLDKKEFYIAVSELNSKTYPYTWDFTNYNMFKSPSTTTTNLAAPSVSSYDGYGKWTKTVSNDETTTTYGVNFKKDVAFEDVTTPKVLFAHGSELCAGSNPIVETAGLGIAGAYTTNSISRSTGGNTYTYYYKTYSNVDGSVSIDGNALKFTEAGEITIPNVANGMYIFLQASNNPNNPNGVYTIPYGLAALWGDGDPFGIKTDVYLYKNISNTTKDFTFKIPANTTISRIAVTDKVKKFGSTGYATESRDTIIDHTYQDKLTNHPVKAYYIGTNDGSAYNYNNYPVVEKLGPVTVVPVRTGVVLYEDKVVENGDHGTFDSPLCVPPVNVTETAGDISNRGKNYMAPSVDWTTNTHLAKDGITFDSGVTGETADSAQAVGGGSGGPSCTKFILTNTYYRYITNKGDDPTAHTINTAAFYHLKTVGRTAEQRTLGGNKAYLLIKDVPTALWNLPGAAAREGMIYIDLNELEADGEATLVDEAVVDRSQQESVYYTLSGVRVNGRPTAKGIYISNGKKITVK